MLSSSNALLDFGRIRDNVDFINLSKRNKKLSGET